MGGIFSSPKRAKVPPPPPFEPPPIVGETGVEDAERKRLRRRSGRRKTFIAGDVMPSEGFLTGKSKTLGFTRRT